MFSRGAAIKMYEVIKIMERKEECAVETYKHVVRRLPGFMIKELCYAVSSPLKAKTCLSIN